MSQLLSSARSLHKLPAPLCYTPLHLLMQDPLPCWLPCRPDKPMMELVAGSRVYYQASVMRESSTEIRVLFPGAVAWLSWEWFMFCAASQHKPRFPVTADQTLTSLSFTSLVLLN